MNRQHSKPIIFSLDGGVDAFEKSPHCFDAFQRDELHAILMPKNL